MKKYHVLNSPASIFKLQDSLFSFTNMWNKQVMCETGFTKILNE